MADAEQQNQVYDEKIAILEEEVKEKAEERERLFEQLMKKGGIENELCTELQAAEDNIRKKDKIISELEKRLEDKEKARREEVNILQENTRNLEKHAQQLENIDSIKRKNEEIINDLKKSCELKIKVVNDKLAQEVISKDALQKKISQSALDHKKLTESNIALKKKIDELEKITDSLENNMNDISKGFELNLRDLEDKNKLEKKLLIDEINKFKENEENFIQEVKFCLFFYDFQSIFPIRKVKFAREKIL